MKKHCVHKNDFYLTKRKVQKSSTEKNLKYLIRQGEGYNKSDAWIETNDFY